MPKEIKVFSMSVLDLLTCSLGGTILISFLLIVSITKSARPGFPYAYFAVRTGVWVDITEAAEAHFGAEKREAWTRLMADDGPYTGAELTDDLNAFIEREYEVELELYRREPGSAPAVPRGTKPLFVVSSAGSGVTELPGQDARVNFRREVLGPRRVTVVNTGEKKLDGKRRLFAAFRLDLAAFRVERGWYFVRLVVAKRPTTNGTGPGTAAWLHLDSGGAPGAARYQTHPTFAETGPDWPLPGGYDNLDDLKAEFPALANWPKRDQEPGDQKTFENDQKRMKSLRLPDLYVPGWPAAYPPKSPAGAEARFKFLAQSPRPDGAGKAEEWVPIFALRCPRAARPAGAARFPTFEIPQEKQPKPPGWHQSDPADPPAFDDYLPGFRIGTGSEK